MAIKIQVSETKVIIQNLFICTVVFYTVYYLTYIVCILSLQLEHFDGLGPFDLETTPSWSNKKFWVNLISLETTFLVCSALFVFIVEEWIWDYACTVTVIHVTVTSLGVGLISMIFLGQILAYLLYKDNFVYPDLNDF
ncbi:putative transmembrane protein 244 [Gastrophryne carolinensis]